MKDISAAQSIEKKKFNYIDTSVWVTSPEDMCDALSEHVRADVVIIGGGYTGLNAALALREEGVDVILLEMDHCGKGASGRNSGHLAASMGKDLPALVKQVGINRAREFMSFNDRSVRKVEEILSKYEIDCDYQPVGNITCGIHLRHHNKIKHIAELANSLGVDLRFFGKEEMRERQLPKAFDIGVLDPRGGHLDPGKYVMGLRMAAIAAGVRIYENTRVVGINEATTPVVITTERGSVRAEKVIVATNGYTPVTLGLLKEKIIPIRVSLFRTARLTQQQLEALGWSGREGIITAHKSIEHYRLTSDNRILGGSKYAKYSYGSKLAEGYQPMVFSSFMNLLRERFPEIPDVKIESFWGGWIGMTPDFLPLSFSNSRSNVFYGMGYNGHGIAHATYNGQLLADQTLGKRNLDVELLKRRMLILPPEPLRWLAVNGLKWYYERVDQIVDTDLRQKKH
ncbi:MAG: FAD-binding oxidoreductase [Moraxellaceae bacterium]|nr:FAD-binding oxidoreductase [Moraxellaceae bacterium]MDZ4387721.1 FAD-binding oxidoreductase [Moraxellaceae bacterium]